MSKKKILTLAMALSMVAILAIGGTIAYFTDTDNDVNVMTLGNVEIEQIEEEYNAEGTLVDFNDGHDLFPMVDNSPAGEFVTTNDDGVTIFNPAVENVVDKFISVENTGDYDAYIRTIIAFETNTVYNADGSVYGDAHDVYIGVLGDFDYLDRVITVDGVQYSLAVKVYEAVIPAGDSTVDVLANDGYSLHQIFMAPTAGNEVVDLFGEEYTILAVSQAVQTAGFDTAAEALNEAFGDLTAVSDETLASWF